MFRRSNTDFAQSVTGYIFETDRFAVIRKTLQGSNAKTVVLGDGNDS